MLGNVARSLAFDRHGCLVSAFGIACRLNGEPNHVFLFEAFTIGKAVSVFGPKRFLDRRRVFGGGFRLVSDPLRPRAYFFRLFRFRGWLRSMKHRDQRENQLENEA